MKPGDKVTAALGEGVIIKQKDGRKALVRMDKPLRADVLKEIHAKQGGIWFMEKNLICEKKQLDLFS